MNILLRLWNDESGAILTAELILLSTILVIGAVAGISVLRVAVVKELKRKGRKRDDVLKEIQSYPISRGMKLRIRDAVKKAWPP